MKTVTMYRANDGKTFESQEVCLKYEARLRLEDAMTSSDMYYYGEFCVNSAEELLDFIKLNEGLIKECLGRE